MTLHQQILFAAITSMALSACGSSEPEAPPPPVKDTVFGDMVGTMDKARGVQDTVNAQKEERDREIEAAERQSEGGN